MKYVLNFMFYAERAAISREPIHIQRGFRRSWQERFGSVPVVAVLHVGLPRRSVLESRQP